MNPPGCAACATAMNGTMCSRHCARTCSIPIGQLRSLTDTRDWKEAFDRGVRLAEKYRKETAVQVEVARLLAAHADQAIRDQNYSEARRGLLLLENDFPNSKEIEGVRSALRSRARSMVEQAEKLEKTARQPTPSACSRPRRTFISSPGCMISICV